MAKDDKTGQDSTDLTKLREDLAALTAQNTQMLDMLVEQRDELDQLRAAGPSVIVAPDAVSKQQAELDAELAGLIEEFKDYPNIQVFEQRVLIGADASMDIRLAGDQPVSVDPHGTTCWWKLRWFNLEKEGRAQQASNEGYVRVLWSELQDQEMVVTGDRTKDYVCRGQRGLEVLHKIPMKLFTYKKKRDAARLTGKLTSEAGLRDHLANSVAALAGKAGDNASQAGDFVHGKQFVTTVTAGPRETVVL